METSKPEKKFEPTINFHTPDKILDLAYSVHTLLSWRERLENRPNLNETENIAMCKRAVAEYNRLQEAFPVDSPEYNYLRAMDPIINAMACAITRLKKEWLAKKSRAEDECNRRVVENSKSAIETNLRQLIKKFLLIGGFGFALAKGVMPWLSLPMETKSQPNFLSFAFAMGLFALIGYVQYKYGQMQNSGLYSYHNYLLWYADREYALSIKMEYGRYEETARRNWLLATGQEAPECRGYDDLLAEHLLLEDEYRHYCTKLSASPWKALVISFVEQAKKAWPKKKKRQPKE